MRAYFQTGQKETRKTSHFNNPFLGEHIPKMVKKKRERNHTQKRYSREAIGKKVQEMTPIIAIQDYLVLLHYFM